MESESPRQPNHMRIQDAKPSINTVTSSEETSDECRDKSKDSSRRISSGDTRESSCRVENTTNRTSKQMKKTKSQTEKSSEASSDTDFVRGEETGEKSSRIRNDYGRRRAPSSEADRYSSIKSPKNESAGSVKSTGIHVSNRTQGIIITWNSEVKRKKAKRKRRKRGPRQVAYSIESSREASHVMLVSAVKFEGVTNDKNDAADNGKHTRDDWREDLLRRTRPH